MATSTITGIRLAGIVACVPPGRETTADLAARFGDDAAHRIAKATGIEERRIAGPGLGSADLAETAARRLLERLDWVADSVDLLVNVTQTRDRVLPGDGFLLHQRLGLAKRAIVLDLTLGCSGFVQGLWTAASLLKAQNGRRALLLTGDVTSRLIDPNDRAVAPLFGDAAAATALLADGEAPPMAFDAGSDGGGAPYLTAGGEGQAVPHLFMDGTQVFAFTLREIPDSLRAAMAGAGWGIGDVDHVVLHQANAQMIRHLAQKIGASAEQTVVALGPYGNTSSASVPLAMAAALNGPLTAGPRRLLLSGFGVGWAWASSALTAGPLAACEVVTGPVAETANPASLAAELAAAAKDAGEAALSADHPAKLAGPKPADR
jgi:3-oxoacyl-[acyl-carrier-protein] synthase III